jgi:hypothetical protein
VRMTDDLYERYKEALRVGHVAVLRGALEEAIEAYRTAATIAPSRALPHTSLGGVLLRLGHLDEALVEYAAAVARAPHDEGALLGQAEALAMGGQRVDAAMVLDHVSEIQEAAARLPEAADTLRRAMELEESVERSRRQRGLLRQIRLSAGDHAAEQLLAKALRLRDEPAEVAAPTSRVETPPAAVWPSADLAAMRSVPEPSSQPEVVSRIEWPTNDVAAAAPTAPAGAFAASTPAGSADPLEQPAADESEAPAEPVTATSGIAAASEDAAPTESEIAFAATSGEASVAAAESTDGLAMGQVPVETAAVADMIAAAEIAAPQEALISIGVMDGAIDSQSIGVGESQHQPTGDELLAAAEAADLSGDVTTLRSLLLWTARAYAREGRFEAGLDATHRLLQRVPSDVDAHLVLVELYVARDWQSLAADKLALLGRLAELNDDTETHERLGVVARRSFPKDERLCAMFG